MITITAGTGRGKSYFIKNDLYDMAKLQNKRILMLIHRKNCVDQFEKEIDRDGKSDSIVVATYQTLESKSKKYIDIGQFDYIVCDEFHYFLSDSRFNKSTDISFRKIMGSVNAVIIMMSATAWDIKKYINLKYPNIKPIEYPIVPDYSFISNLTFFNKEESMESIARDIINDPSGCKGVFFIQSARVAYELYKKFKKYSMFCRGGKNSKECGYVDQTKLEQMLVNERFGCRLLITTACLDAGVNIVDDKLTKIIVQMDDVGSLIQCIGRKRLQHEEDRIDVFIKNITNENLSGKYKRVEKQVEMARYYKEFGAEAYGEKYYRQNDSSCIIYDENIGSERWEKRINELMYHKMNSDMLEYKYMMSLGKYGYCERIAGLLGKYDDSSCKYNYSVYPENYDLEHYLEENVGKFMPTPDDRRALIHLLDTTSGGRQLKSIGAVNASLKERRLKYIVNIYDTTIDGHRRKYAWKIERRK